jgi:hypothetical protein
MPGGERTLRLALSCALVCVAACTRSPAPAGAGAQAPAPTAERAPGQPWEAHARTLLELQAKGQTLTSEERLRLINMLNEDMDYANTRSAQQPGGEADESFGEYLIDLSSTVARLKDPRALPVLVRVMDVSDGIDSAIAEFGDPAVAPVVAAAADPDMRPAAADTLGLLLKGRPLKRNSLTDAGADQVAAALAKLAADPAPLVRARAVKALAFAKPSESTLKLVQGLASADPAQRAGKGKSTQQVVYPVRDAAAATLSAWSKSNP